MYRKIYISRKFSQNFWLYVLRRVIVATNHELCKHREFLSCKAQSLLGHIVWNAFYLDENTAGSDRRHESLGVTFTFTHSHLSGLLGYRLVREDSDPDLTLTLHVAGHCHTGSLDLTTGDPLRVKSLDSERAESELIASLGLTFHAALLRTAVSCFLRL